MSRRKKDGGGTSVEERYEEVRALRIYEGASDVHKLLIARGVLSS